MAYGDSSRESRDKSIGGPGGSGLGGGYGGGSKSGGNENAAAGSRPAGERNTTYGGAYGSDGGSPGVTGVNAIDHVLGLLGITTPEQAFAKAVPGSGIANALHDIAKAIGINAGGFLGKELGISREGPGTFGKGPNQDKKSNNHADAIAAILGINANKNNKKKKPNRDKVVKATDDLIDRMYVPFPGNINTYGEKYPEHNFFTQIKPTQFSDFAGLIKSLTGAP